MGKYSADFPPSVYIYLQVLILIEIRNSVPKFRVTDTDTICIWAHSIFNERSSFNKIIDVFFMSISG